MLVQRLHSFRDTKVPPRGARSPPRDGNVLRSSMKQLCPDLFPRNRDSRSRLDLTPPSLLLSGPELLRIGVRWRFEALKEQPRQRGAVGLRQVENLAKNFLEIALHQPELYACTEVQTIATTRSRTFRTPPHRPLRSLSPLGPHR